MKIHQIGILAAAVCMAGVVLGAESEDKPVGVPLKPDPPFAVDGDLGDWSSVPLAMPVAAAEQVVWGKGAWRSAQDFSGTVRLAWRHDHLFVAAAVTDDRLSQTQRGDGIWRGDHVEVYLDVQPDLEPGRSMFGRGQFQFAFSPGNFQRTGDALADCPPESYCYRPRAGSVDGVKLGAKPTARGWTVEAAIPWALLGLPRGAAGTVFRFEIALSDTDSPEQRQESLMTTSSARWAHTRSRLTWAVLAGSDGQAPPVVRRVPIFGEVRLAQGAKQSFTFDAPATPEGRDAVIALRARLDTPKVAGHTPALTLDLNGQRVAGRRLLDKPLRVQSRGGRVYSMAAGDRLTTYYSPDYTKPDLHPHYGLLKGVKPCEFALRVTDLVRPGRNELVVLNLAHPKVKRVLVAADARLEFRVPPPPAKVRAPAPRGPLPVIEPRRDHKTDYQVDAPADGPTVRVSVAGVAFTIESRFSTPEPKWTYGSNRYFRHSRRVDKRDEAIVVQDTFTNLTDRPLAVMQRHEARLGDRIAGLWLAGLRRPGHSGSSSEPSNPTTFVTADGRGLGLVALSDVMRLHGTNYAVAGTAGLGDNNLALRPKGTYTAEWAIVPVDRPDYWRFINAVRRLMHANFSIGGGFAFLRADPRLTGRWSDEQIQRFIQLKDARYVCASISYPRYKGRYTHGTAFQRVTHEHYRKAFARRRRLVPGVKNLVYFHCFLDVTDDAPTRFADSRVLRPDGKQADYGKPHQRIFCPTTANSYGPEVAKNVDIILDKIGAEGVYWDEHERSAYSYHYGEPWDGFSCDVNPKALTVTRLKSCVTLLSEAWRVALAKRIMARGPLIGNGPPVTRAMADLKFPCFVETGSITNCTRAHLHSPIALGDHLTERSEEDAYDTMLAALDYGCVYHWYNDMTVSPTHHHLTRYMFPITPVELHAGYVIGKERIITKASGLFGWGDAAQHEVHVFDHTGREASGYKTPTVRRGNRTYAEIRLAEGWSAAVVRK